MVPRINSGLILEKRGLSIRYRFCCRLYRSEVSNRNFLLVSYVYGPLQEDRYFVRGKGRTRNKPMEIDSTFFPDPTGIRAPQTYPGLLVMGYRI